MNEQDLLTALGPLAPLYQDPAITEIMVDAPTRIHVERNGRLEKTDVQFESAEAIQHCISAIAHAAGYTFAGEALVEVQLPNGTRMVAVPAANAKDGPCCVIRKPMPRNITCEMLVEWGSISAEALKFLKDVILERKNILVSGGTASGKTTILNLLADLIPADERVIVVEEAREIQLSPRPCGVQVEAGGPAQVPYLDLINLAARLRPERLVFGEARGPEVLRMLQIISFGHDGSMTTIHADSPSDALARLEVMCLMANLGLGLGEIRTIIAGALNVIVQQNRLRDGRRRIMEITELRGLENERYVLVPLFRYHHEQGVLERTGAKASWENG